MKSVVACAVVVTALLIPAAAGAAPPNDHFANAEALPSTGGSSSGDSTGATEEPGEPDHWLGVGAGKSIWYSWTSPGQGQAEVDLCGSFGGEFGPVVAVYTGPVVSALTLVTAETSDVTGQCSPRAFFNTTPGATYYIAADGLSIRPQREGPVNVSLKFQELGPEATGGKKKCRKGYRSKKVKGKRKCVKKKRRR